MGDLWDIGEYEPNPSPESVYNNNNDEDDPWTPKPKLAYYDNITKKEPNKTSEQSSSSSSSLPQPTKALVEKPKKKKGKKLSWYTPAQLETVNKSEEWGKSGFVSESESDSDSDFGAGFASGSDSDSSSGFGDGFVSDSDTESDSEFGDQGAENKEKEEEEEEEEEGVYLSARDAKGLFDFFSGLGRGIEKIIEKNEKTIEDLQRINLFHKKVHEAVDRAQLRFQSSSSFSSMETSIGARRSTASELKKRILQRKMHKKQHRGRRGHGHKHGHGRQSHSKKGKRSTKPVSADLL